MNFPNFLVEKFKIEKFMVEMSGVGKFLLSLRLKSQGLECSWLESSWLKLWVEKSGVEMFFNHKRQTFFQLIRFIPFINESNCLLEKLKLGG